jgi:hypothetical protein
MEEPHALLYWWHPISTSSVSNIAERACRPLALLRACDRIVLPRDVAAVRDQWEGARALYGYRADQVVWYEVAQGAEEGSLERCAAHDVVAGDFSLRRSARAMVEAVRACGLFEPLRESGAGAEGAGGCGVGSAAGLGPDPTCTLTVGMATESARDWDGASSEATFDVEEDGCKDAPLPPGADAHTTESRTPARESFGTPPRLQSPLLALAEESKRDEDADDCASPASQTPTSQPPSDPSRAPADTLSPCSCCEGTIRSAVP